MAHLVTCAGVPTHVLQEEVDPNDEAALEAFMARPGGGGGAVGDASGGQMSLGDLIVSKLREKQREAGVSVLPRCGRRDVGGRRESSAGKCQGSAWVGEVR